MNPLHQSISTSDAPGAIGPYSQAIVAGPGTFVFLSGQVALCAKTGLLIGDDAAAQAEQVMRNLSAVLSAAGCSFAHVVKTTIYLTDMANFAAVNEVYGRYLLQDMPRPARATVQVAGLPRGALVEIDAIAIRS